MLSNAKFKRVCLKALNKVKTRAPYDSGNLSIHGVQCEFPSPNVCRIYIDEVDAPYMPYTNEPWLSPYWNGKKNPNEGWWQDATEIVGRLIAQELEGELKKNGK